MTDTKDVRAPEEVLEDAAKEEAVVADSVKVDSTPAGDDAFADAQVAHDVELERLLGAVENETGYAQKQAIVALRKFLGRPALREA